MRVAQSLLLTLSQEEIFNTTQITTIYTSSQATNTAKNSPFNISSSASSMSTAGPGVGPTSPPPAWQPAAAGTRTRVQDRIGLFESAGSIEARNSAASSDSISSRPHRHLRTSSAGDFNQELEEEAVLGFEGTMGSRTELNRQLQMKADELERIFAEHKRRVATKPVVEGSGMNRGRMYERYMEKRDAKRREEQGRNRGEEEAKRRAMWESVERSEAELEQWYKRQENDPTTNEEEETLSSVLAEDEEEDVQSSDGSQRSVNSKMHRSRTMSSSTSSKPPTSRFSRSSDPISGFRKENTKPSTVISKSNTHTQPISVPRSKSTTAGASFFKEEKPPRSASSRKSSVAPLTSLRITTKEQSGSKPFLKKGKGIDPGAGSGLSKLRTSMSSSLNEASVNDVDTSSSPTGSITSSLYSRDGTRVRKKWGAAQIPFLAPDSSLKRFLHFGKKSTVGDRASILAASGADYDTEVGRDLVSEQIRGSRLGFPLHSCDGFSFSEGMGRHEQQEVQTPRRSIPTPTNFNVRKDHLSENSPKSPRSFFSLSAFRNRGVESRLR